MKHIRIIFYILVMLASSFSWALGRGLADSSDSTEPAVEAVDFNSRIVYRPKSQPGYASWVSFFPGEKGQWYIGCEEVSLPEQPLKQVSPQRWYEMGLPAGYDKSQYLMEAVLLESTDNMKTWKVISREPYRHQHSVHQFASARTKDGRFLRFNWAAYSLDTTVKTNEILHVSEDNGKTWKPAKPFCLDRFAYFPHRLRTLSDGTLVLCLPYEPRWGKGTDRPTRTAKRLDTNNEMKMSLFFSFDQGRSWQGPLPIFGGQNVSETDFVELPDGNLLFFNNSIFAKPGRQFVYRNKKCFMPGPLEFVHSGTVPETVCLTKDSILVGCMRPGKYFWSDDLGQNWHPLKGVSGYGEVYQPWIYALDDGTIACAGHFGGDDPIGYGRRHENYINLHTFRIKVNRHTIGTKIWVVRDYDKTHRRWLNSYTISLTQENGKPLPDKELEFWYVERDKPGYDSWNKTPLKQRMKIGGTLLKIRTGKDGKAHVKLPDRFNKITNQHLSYQLIVRFNMDGSDPLYRSFQTPQLEFYAYAPMPPKLKAEEKH